MTKTLMGSPLRKSSRPPIDHTQDWAWVNEHLNEYRGLWVRFARDTSSALIRISGNLSIRCHGKRTRRRW